MTVHSFDDVWLRLRWNSYKTTLFTSFQQNYLLVLKELGKIRVVLM